MAIPVECTFCFQKYRVRDEFAGKAIKCKECGGELRVPSGGPAKSKPSYLDDDEEVGGSYSAKGSDDWESSFGAGSKPKKRSAAKPPAVPLKRSTSRSQDDADDDDVPSGRTFKKKKADRGKLFLIIGLAAFASIAAVVVGIIFSTMGKGDPKLPPQANNLPPGFPQNQPGNPPPGFPNNAKNAFPQGNNGFPVRPDPSPPALGAQPPGLENNSGFPSPPPVEPQIPKFNPGVNPPNNPPGLGAQGAAGGEKKPEKKKGGTGFQPVAGEANQGPADSWEVKVDPSAEQYALEPDAKVHVVFPKGSKLEIVYPLNPSPFVAVGSNNNEKEFREIRDLRNNHKVGTVKGVRIHGDPWALSPDGHYLAGWVVFEKAVRVWDVKTGKPLGQLEFEKGGFLRILAFAGNDRLLAGSHDGTVMVWQIPSGKEERPLKLPIHVGDNQFGISPGGKYFAYVEGDHAKTSLRVYDLTTGNLAGTSLITGENVSPHQCKTLEFSPDGKELAVLFDNWKEMNLVIINVENGEQTAILGFENSIKDSPRGRNRKDRPLAWFPNKQRWLLNGVGLIDRATEKIVWTMPGADQDPGYAFPTACRILDDEHVLVAASDAKETRIVDFKLPESEVAQAANVVASGGLAVDARLPLLSKAEFGAPKKLASEAGGAPWSMRPDPVGADASQLLTKPFTLSPEENPLRGARLSGPEAARLVVLYGAEKGPARPRRSPRRGKAAEAPASGDAPSCSLEVVDLATRKEIADIDLPYNADLLSVTLDGKYAVVRMIDGLTRLDIFSLDDSSHYRGWRPYGHLPQDNEQKVKAAVFVDDKHLLTLNQSDLLVMWDLSSMEAIYQIERAAHPGVSPGRKYLSVSNGKGFRLFDSLTGEVRGDVEFGEFVHVTGAAGFNSRGDRLAATVNRNNGMHLIAWDLSTGKIVNDFPIPLPAQQLQWCGDDYVLLDNRSLIDVPHKMLVWNYTLPPGKGVHLDDNPDGRHWYLSASGGQNSSVTVTAADLPHAAAVKQLESSKLDPGYLLQPGSKVSVRFNITSNPPGVQNFQQDVWKNLQTQLAKNQVTVVDNERLVLYVSLTHRNTNEKHSFRMTGFGRLGGGRSELEVAGQEVECGLQLWLDNKVVWNGNVKHTNGAFFIHLKEGVSVEQHLQEQMWNASTQHLLKLTPPKYVLPETAANGLGQSQLTADGVR